jgi:DNA-binding response OmpR family regulator
MAEVMVVRWPEDGDEGLRLTSLGAAVLYLVGADDDPPIPTSCLEDWIRIPGDDRDLRARVAALELRASNHYGLPRIDADGRLHYQGKVVALPLEEVPLARLLTERFGDLVPDAELTSEAENASTPLRARMARLRGRLRAHDLTLRRIRRKGYVLQGR